jgi:hypothetical protein
VGATCARQSSVRVILVAIGKGNADHQLKGGMHAREGPQQLTIRGLLIHGFTGSGPKPDPAPQCTSTNRFRMSVHTIVTVPSKAAQILVS